MDSKIKTTKSNKVLKIMAALNEKLIALANSEKLATIKQFHSI